MESHAPEIKLGATGIVATLTAFWGWFGWLVLVWVLTLLADYGTGSLAAVRKGEWSSERARTGIWSKLGSIAVVLVAGALDLIISVLLTNINSLPFTYTVLLCPVVMSWYILTEVGSILENAGEMGAPLPAFFVRAIAVLHKKVERAGDKAADNMDD